MDAEKQFTKIIRRVKFIKENNLWLFIVWKIFDLAIIIKAAIKTLKIIKMADMVSIEVKLVIKVSFWWIKIVFIVVIRVKKNNDNIVIHQ